MLSGRVVRQSKDRIAVAFDCTTGLERDLLIRRIFTARLPDAMTVVASAWSVTGKILKSIWVMPSAARVDRNASSLQNTSVTPGEKLPTASLVVPPQPDGGVIERAVALRKAPVQMSA